MKTSLLLAVTAAALLLVPGLGTSAHKPSPVAGKWAGKMNEDGDIYRAEVKIERKLVRGRRGGSIAYPSIPCGGKLIYLRRKGNSHFLREKLTYGLNNCSDDGLNRFRRVGKKVAFLWTEADTDDPSTVVGNLRRQR